MAQSSGFFNAQLSGTTYDRVYLAESFANYFSSFIGNGIFGGSMEELEVLEQDSPNMSIKVASGRAFANGYWYQNDSDYTLDVQIADGTLSRIDLVVVRWDNEERDMYLHIITGEPSESPTEPEYIRSPDYYDLVIAKISIPAGTSSVTQSLITDTRLNATYCGLVTGVIEQVDLTDLYNQFTSFYEDFTTGYVEDFDTWSTQQMEDFTTWSTQQRNAFDTWFASIQDILDEDIAAYLLENKQDKTDNNLTTINKTIVGAINEVKAAVDDLGTTVGELSQSVDDVETAMDELSEDLTTVRSWNIMVPSWTSDSTLSYGFNGSAVVFNNEIHILGGASSSDRTNHYKWDGTTWTSVSTLPYNFYGGQAVVYNNEIHILGGGDNLTKHYKWNGSSWTEVSTLPYNFYNGSAVVFNNEIHILGALAGSTNHYKWNGTTWTSVSTLPYNFYNGSAVVFNNEIHILGSSFSSTTQTNHYKWNGTTWTSVSTLPYNFYIGSAVVLNNEIHILGGRDGYTKHYKLNGTSWVNVSTLPYEFSGGSAVVFNNEIHILGSETRSTNTNHYSYGGTTWSSNPDSTTSTDYPYIYEIQSDVFTDDSKPIWQLEGAGTITTSTENDEIAKVALAYFSTTGITLYATEQPSVALTLVVKGVD